jgi:hypothetical protein
MLRRVCLLGLLVAVLGMPRFAHAEAVPAKNQALLLLRILAYDHNLANRIDNKTVTIAVVAKGGNSDSEDIANELVSVIRELAKSTTISNNAINVVRLSYTDKTFDADIAKTKAAALYVAPGLGDAIVNIAGVTHERKLLTFTGSADYVVTLAVGFALYDSKPTILVNIPASRAEGADLDPALLRVAKIIKK